MKNDYASASYVKQKSKCYFFPNVYVSQFPSFLKYGTNKKHSENADTCMSVTCKVSFVIKNIEARPDIRFSSKREQSTPLACTVLVHLSFCSSALILLF